MNIENTSDQGATIDGTFVSWSTLRSAANQEDADLAAIYADILRRADRAEDKRIISEDWRHYGYPLRTGFSRRYSGQIVSRAWEIRRLRAGDKDVRVAYILTFDRSDRRITRTASPYFADYDAALNWLSVNYGAWDEELGGERTAQLWFVA